MNFYYLFCIIVLELYSIAIIMPSNPPFGYVKKPVPQPGSRPVPRPGPPKPPSGFTARPR